jgi:type I restriction enzyme S subunit
MSELKGDLTEDFKMTELGPLPEEWEVVRLGDYCHVYSGYAFKSSDFCNEGALVVKIGNLQNGSIVLDNRSSFFPSDKVDDYLQKFVLREGDILIALTGATTGKIAIVPEKFKGALLNQRVGKFDIFDNALHRLFSMFYFSTNNFQESIKTGILQSAQGNISPKEIESFLIPLPPLPEQEKIAAILFGVQEAKEKTEAVISATKSLKKSMMSYLFTYGPVPLLEAENVPLKETEIGMLPEEWEVVRLGDVADFVMGQSPPGSTYNEIGKGFPFLQGKAEFGPLHPIHIKHTTKPMKIAPKNSVLLSVRAPVGDVNLADIDYCIGRGLASLSLSEGSNLFLFYVLSYLKGEIEKEGTGSTFKAITKIKLMNIKIPLPPLSTQQKFASILSAIDQKIEAEENRKKALEDLFKTLLHNLMTAKIRVNNLEVGV